MKKINIRALILSLVGLALFGGLVYLVVGIVTTDWRKYDINEVESLFTFYYGEEGFEKVADGFTQLSDVGIIAPEGDDRQVLLMKNYTLGAPDMSDEDKELGHKYRYLLLETGLSLKEVEEDYQNLQTNINNTREYYAENGEGDEVVKGLYDGAVFGRGRNYVYAIFSEEAELMEREMQMLLK